MITIQDLFSLDKTYPEAAEYLSAFTYGWEALSGISELIIKIGKNLPEEEYDHPSENIWIAKDAVVFPSAFIGAPCIIGRRTEVRHCAFIRGSALVGDDCVVGNSTELKNVILFNDVQVPHYNYVGDSILGYKAHMGAGSITSNVRSDKQSITVHDRGTDIPTGIRKIGAMVGDHAEIGCNAVLNPGTVVGRNSVVYPLCSVRGTIPQDSICKTTEIIVEKR